MVGWSRVMTPEGFPLKSHCWVSSFSLNATTSIEKAAETCNNHDLIKHIWPLRGQTLLLKGCKQATHHDRRYYSMFCVHVKITDMDERKHFGHWMSSSLPLSSKATWTDFHFFLTAFLSESSKHDAHTEDHCQTTETFFQGSLLYLILGRQSRLNCWLKWMWIIPVTVRHGNTLWTTWCSGPACWAPCWACCASHQFSHFPTWLKMSFSTINTNTPIQSALRRWEGTAKAICSKPENVHFTKC